MAERTWQGLVLGELPEAEEILSRPVFEKKLPVDWSHVRDPDRFEDALSRSRPPDVILIDVEPHGMNVLALVREHFPVAPVVMVGDEDDAPTLLNALREGLERHVMRVDDREMFVQLASQVVYSVLEHSVEPPNMDMPSSEQMHRFAHYHHILHPFFVIGPNKRMLFANAAAERLHWQLKGETPVIGESILDGPLAQLGEPFERQLEDALDGKESVVVYDLEELGDPSERSVHCQPLTSRSERTVAASVAIHHEIPVEVERNRTMRVVGRFAGGLAHDVNNLLNVMMVQSELLRAYLDEVPPNVDKCLQSIAGAVSDGSKLTRELLAISHESLTHRVAVQLNDLISAIEPQLRDRLREGQTLRIDTQQPLPPVNVDPQQIEQLVTNLVQNSIDALNDHGEIDIRTASVDPNDGDSVPRGLEKRPWVELIIADNGPGVHPKLHSRIFEPFFTTRRGRGHSGLGLTIAHAVVDQVGGHIFVDSEPDRGATFTIYLAASQPQEGEQRQPEVSEAPKQGPSQAIVLVVEDEDDLRLPFRETLAQRNYEVLEAAEVSRAKELIAERGADIDLLITDVVMPGGSGIDLVRDCLQRFPEVKVIFVSGYTAEVLEDAEGEIEVEYQFLSKPVSLHRLAETAERLLSVDASGDADGVDEELEGKDGES